MNKKTRIELDKLWSKVVRRLAKYTCQRCRKKHAENSKGLHAHHIFTRTYLSTRYFLLNGYCICYGCHSWAHRNPLEFHEAIKFVMGEEKYNQLLLAKNTPSKPDPFTIKIFLESYLEKS